MLRPHRLRLGEMLVAFRHVEAVEPRGVGAEAFFRPLCALVVEEEDIRCDRGVGRKDAARQADHGVEIELPEQFLFNGQLCIVGAEEESVGENDGGTAVFGKTVHDEHHEEVGRLA